MENSFELVIISIHSNLFSFQIKYILEMSSSQESDSDDEEYCKERRAMKLLEMVAKEIERYCEVAKESTAKMDDTARNTYKEVIDAGKDSH